MKTIHTIKTIYTIEELDETAQQAAHDAWIQSGYEYPWLYESLESVKHFLSFFGSNIKNYSLGTWGHSYIDIEELSNDSIRGINKTILNGMELSDGFYIGEVLQECVIKSFEKTGDLKYSIQSAIDSAVSAIVGDMDDCASLEAFIETAEANGWMFLKSGDHYFE